MPSQLTGGSKTSIYLYQALFGQAPGAKLLSDATANATTNTVAFANELGAGFNAVPTTTFVAGVMANLGLSSTYAGFSAGGYAGLQAALVQYYDAAGVANRGYVTLQLASLLTDSAHERDATYGSAAANFINQTAANYNYASVSTNTASTTVSVTPVVNLALTTGADNITGTAGNDMFVAWIMNNSNTLQSGDVIDGGLGVNRLDADIGNSQNFAITASTKNVQTVAIRAEAVAVDSNNNNMVDPNLVTGGEGATTYGNQVQIDAQRMVGVTQWESNNSRADVVIEDVRIQANQITKDITIAMVETDPGHVDMGVYFDQLSLRNVSSSTSQLNLQVMDTRSVVNGTAPLLSSPYAGFKFTSTNAAGVATVVTLQSQAIDDAQTYAELVTAYQAAANAVFGAGVVTVSLGKSFTVTDTTTATAVTGNEITITAAGAFTFTTPTGSGFIATGVVPANSGLHTNFNTGSTTSTDLVTSKIILDDVGRGSTGGDLVVGGLSVGDTSSSLGVQRFEIEVRDNSKLEHISSTNNTLKEVTIVNGKTSSISSAYVTTVTDAGNLTVNGNSGANGANVTNGNATDAQTGQNALLPGSTNQNGFGFSDVRLIDASTMTGKLAFSAEVTTASLAKYMNLTDIAAPAADNVAFTYTGGTNDDTMFVQIDGGVASSRSNILSGREDFTFTANGGAGNDNITLKLVNGQLGNTEAWYNNQKLNANVFVNGGDGNDTIKTPGAGDVQIDGGAGNDTIYTDNTGAQNVSAVGNTAGLTIASPRAVYVLNTANQLAVAGGYTLATNDERNLADLKSGANDSLNLYKGKLTVTFKDLTKTVDIDSTSFKTSDLQINQAIKNAINNDAVLNKLLVATDGPANTLVVTSLIDGVLSNANFGVAIAASPVGTISAADLASAVAAYGGVAVVGGTGSDADLLAYMNGLAAAKTNATGDYLDQLAETGASGVAANLEIAGAASTSTSDNTITGGLGDDVIVLGTTVGATTLAASNETVVYASGAFGADTIVNFGASTVADTGTKQVFAVTFAGSETGGDTTVAFDGVTVTLAAVVGGAALATDYIAKYNANPAATYVATALVDVVTFTQKVATTVAVGGFVVTPVTADALAVTATPAAPTATGATSVIDADILNFTALGGSTVAFGAINTNKSIVVAAQTAGVTAGTDNGTAALVAALYTDSATAATHVYVAYDAATNVGKVYQVVDAVGATVGASNVVATLVGTIDLADTNWNTLTAANFS